MKRQNMNTAQLIYWVLSRVANDNFAYLSGVFAANCLIAQKKKT